MEWFWYIPFIVQGLVIVWDEFYFHWKRGLPLWERIGHPLDSFTVVLCLSYVLLFPYSKEVLLPFVILAVLSCLFVTKDEFVHKEHCDGKEQWLHAVLFLNHPLVMISMGMLWARGAGSHLFLTSQLVFTSLFCLYQLVYWNLVWKEK
ncbi:MAG: hypothetical protein K940chlam9_01640 [Chlamydiae bacterium]|nr:hypothetical protein [Chlamydiota bacterium]